MLDLGKHSVRKIRSLKGLISEWYRLMLDVGIRFGAIKGVVFCLKMMKTGPDSGENLILGLGILWHIPWWCSSRLRTCQGSITRIDTTQTGKTNIFF